MHFGIPAYRLPRDVLTLKSRASRPWASIVLNHKVEDLLAEKTGAISTPSSSPSAHTSASGQDIPARDAGEIFDALQFLQAVEAIRVAKIGRRVAIYGGGNTAMDAARTVDGSEPTPIIIYRRTREQMPAHAFEADEAIEEGVKIHWLRTIKQIDGTTVTVEVMASTAPGSRSRPASSRRSTPTRSSSRSARKPTPRSCGPSRASSSARTARSRSGRTCRPAAPACSPAATWCRSSAR